VLELHGWGELQDELNAMTKQELWARLAEVIPDEIVDAFAVVGTPEEVVAELRQRFEGLLTRIQVRLPDGIDPDRRAALLAGLRAPIAEAGVP
jgi:alkanesulfonate monooxygenase SsuD/methylene tetrahydromethanopterin reductase-like flavin-dependent oxidoreductase (luciferase family)